MDCDLGNGTRVLRTWILLMLAILEVVLSAVAVTNFLCAGIKFLLSLHLFVISTSNFNWDSFVD